MDDIKNTRDKTVAIEDLTSTIAAWSLSATDTLLADMYEVLEEDRITPEQNFKTYLEMLTFFLLSFERYSQASGGEEVLSLLNNEIVNGAINLVLDEVNGLSPGSHDNKILDVIDYYNAAAKDYDTCQVLVEKKPDYEGTHTVLGKLGTRIASVLDKPAIPEIIDMVSVVAAEALVESELKKKVIKVSSLVGK